MTSDQLHITSWNSQGHGIAEYKRADGKIVNIAVPESIVGETVFTTPPLKSRSGRVATITDIPLPSPFRVQPRCPHFSECGGCVWQHMSYDHQLEVKNSFIASLFLPLSQETIGPILGCSSPWQYRNKMEFSFSQDKKGEHFLGLFHRQSRVTNIQTCPITSPWMTQTVEQVRKWWKTTRLSAYHARTNKGSILTLTTREGKTDRMVILTVSGNPRFAPHKEDLASFIAAVQSVEAPGNLSIVLRIRQIAKGNPTQLYEMILSGPDYIRETLEVEVLPGKKESLEFHISPQTFFQPNTEQAIKIYSTALQMANLTQKDTVLDLYCGIGIFGMFSALHASKSFGIELSKDAAYDARTNAKRLGLGNFTIYCGDTAQVMEKEKIPPPTTVIIDPPRSGLHSNAIKEIEALSPQTIVYVSCNPLTQYRDVTEMISLGWQIERIQPIDQFPHTPHIENIILLKRKA